MNIGKVKKRYLLWFSIGLALAIAGLFLGSAATPNGQPPLKRIEEGNARPFQDTFNAATKNVRMVLLLSPT